MSATVEAVKATTAVVVEKLTMTAHPAVMSAAVTGNIADVMLKVLSVTNPDIFAVLKGAETQVAILIGVVFGFLTGRRPT